MILRFTIAKNEESAPGVIVVGNEDDGTRGGLQALQAISNLGRFVLGRVATNDANTHLGGIFSSRVGYEIRCQVRVPAPECDAFDYIHDKMPSVSGAQKFQAAIVPSIHLATAKCDDGIRFLRVVDDEASSRLKEQ